MSSTFVSPGVAQFSLLMHSLAEVTFLFVVDGLSRLLLRLVSSTCHPCPLDDHATLTGFDQGRNRLGEISI